MDSSPAALRRAWSRAVDPIARARNTSYDTVLTMMLPGKEPVCQRRRRRPDRRRTPPDRADSPGERDTFVAVGADRWQRAADRVVATRLAPIDLPEPRTLHVGVRAPSLVSLTTTYGHPCIKGELIPELGLTALGFGRWLRLDPDLTRRLTGCPLALTVRPSGPHSTEDDSFARANVTASLTMPRDADPDLTPRARVPATSRP